MADGIFSWSRRSKGYVYLSHRPANRLDYLHAAHLATCLLALLCTYILAQFDKFVLSYYTTQILTDIGIGASSYGLLSGYGTSIIIALTAIPIAYVADRSNGRLLVLVVSVVWWSLMVIFQGLSHKFWQIILARIAMALGQAAVEALCVSLIFDMLPMKMVPVGESFLYVGVYIGELISSNLSVAFPGNWRATLKGVGIAGFVVFLALVLLVREPARRREYLNPHIAALSGVDLRNSFDNDELNSKSLTPSSVVADTPRRFAHLRGRKGEFMASLVHIISLRSFWLITVSAAFRQLSGNVFGYYMPSYLGASFPDFPNVLANYGIITGVVGTFAVLSGGFISAAYSDTKPALPLYIAGIGGAISSIFVIFMVLSPVIAGSGTKGVALLYAMQTLAYLTAEMWLGAIATIILRLVPFRFKTVSYAIYGIINILVYSSGPEIIGIAQASVGADIAGTVSQQGLYIRTTRIILAVIIPAGYCIAAVGFLYAARADMLGEDLKQLDNALFCEGRVGVDPSRDNKEDISSHEVIEAPLLVGKLSSVRRISFIIGGGVLLVIVIGLLVASFVLRE